MLLLQASEIPQEYTFHIACCDKIGLDCLHAACPLLPASKF